MSLRDRVAVVGVGRTELSKDSGVTTLTLALRAIAAALDDAGLSLRDVDGVATHGVGDSAPAAVVAATLGLSDVAFLLGYLLIHNTDLSWQFILGTSTFLAAALFLGRIGLPGGATRSYGYDVRTCYSQPLGQRFAPYSFSLDLPPGDYEIRVLEDDPSGGAGRPVMTDSRRITVIA